MSKSGTRRTTILKRRAGRTARLVFYGKRFGLLLCILVLAGFALHVVSNSQWLSRTEEAFAVSAHQKLARAGFKTKGLLIDGRQCTSREDLKQVLNIKKDESIFSYDLADIQKKLIDLPWVGAATVERRLPDTIYVRLQERVPVALYQKNNRLTLVDKDGMILTDQNLGQFKNMVVITGEHAPQNAAELIGMIQAEPDLKSRISIARWIGNRRWDIELKNGITIRLPEDDAGLAIKRLAEAQKNEKVMDRQVQAIDLRDANRIVVQTAPGAVEKYEAGYRKEKNI